MTGDRWVRRWTVAAVASVGAVAAVLSYRHQYELALAHGESALTARLLPVSIDGLLLAGTLAVLDASRRGHRAWAARITVGLGVAMTMWANIVHGIAFGWSGIIISGWPPVALIAAVEVLARMLRSPAPETGSVAEQVQVAVPALTQFPAPPADMVSSAAPADAESAATAALVSSIAGGNALSQNQLMTRFRLTRAEATKVRAAVRAEANGHAPIATDSTEGGEH